MTKINKRTFTQAIKNSAGIIKAVAERLETSRTAVYNYINKHKFAQGLLLEERETTGDLAETGLISLIKEKDFKAIKYYLSTKCKDRGFVEKQEVEHSGSTDNKIIFEVHNYAKKNKTDTDTKTRAGMGSSNRKNKQKDN